MTRSDTVAFLTCVLPPEGIYCAAVFKTQTSRPHHVFFETIEQLSDFILAQDQLGRTVYHACASFRTATKRTGANVMAARSLWFDIDTLEGSPKATYADRQEAAEAVVAFCRAVDLPLPLFVDSGYGLHCYWPLAEALAPDTWLQYAAGLKQLAFQHGLKIDPARTADIASILRTPGTHNRKNGERLVQFDAEGTQRHAVASFGTVAVPAPVRRLQPPPGDTRNTISGGRRRSISAAIDNGHSYGAVYADDVADRCAAVAALRESGSVEGWFLRVGVLAFCADGEVKAHEWSANDYDAYDPAVVDDRLERSRRLTGATTCERFHGIDPEVCERCPLYGKIASPISAPGQVTRDIRLEQPATADRGEVDALPFVPEGYRWSDKMQLLFVTEDKSGPITVTVTEHPCYLKSVQTGEMDRSTFSYRFTKQLPREGWSDVIIDAKTMFGPGGIAEFFGKGVVIHDPKLFLTYARHAVDDFHKNAETHVRYDQFGWKNDNQSFLYGKMLYTSIGPIEAIGAKEVETRSQWIGPKKGGNVEAWTEAADALFASDMEA